MKTIVVVCHTGTWNHLYRKFAEESGDRYIHLRPDDPAASRIEGLKVDRASIHCDFLEMHHEVVARLHVAVQRAGGQIFTEQHR